MGFLVGTNVYLYPYNKGGFGRITPQTTAQNADITVEGGEREMKSSTR